MPLNSLKKIVSNAWKIPNYSVFYKKHHAPKVIKSLNDLKKIPLLNKDLYFSLTKKNPLKFGQKTYVFKTIVNLNGDEAVFPLSVADYQNYINFEKRKFKLIGVKKTDLCSIAAFSSNHAIPLSQSFLALGASYIPLDGDEIKIFNDLIRHKITVLFTIAPFVYRFMEYVKVRNLKTSLRLIITTGVKIPDVSKLNSETKKVLGAELIDTIGATELASFAFSCNKHRNLYHFVDQQQIIEIIDPITKQSSDEGEIVITPLWKIDFPLLRYETGDLTKLEKTLSCNCPVKNKTLFTGIEKRLVQSTRIERYLVDLKDFYDQIRNSLLWQSAFDRRLWWFLEKPALAVLITKIRSTDVVLVFIEKTKFILTLRNRQIIEEAIFKMTNAEVKLILCDKSLIKKASPNYQDIRDISKKKMPKEINDLLNLC